MSRPTLSLSRQIHLYFGVFITPAILFFAITGALQTAGLHETSRDRPNYVPAKWIAVLAQIHKKQNTTLRVRPPQAAATPAAATAAPDPSPQTTPDAAHPHHHHDEASPETAAATAPQTTPTAPQPPAQPGKKHNPIPMRLFFFVVCLGLFTSTFTGLFMTYKFNRNKALITATLIAGTVLPPLLLLF